MSIKAHCARHAKDHAKGSLGDCKGGCACRGGGCPPNPKSSPVIRVGNGDVIDEKVDDEMAPKSDIQHDDDDNLTSQHNDVTHDEYNDEDITRIDTETLLPTTEL